MAMPKKRCFRQRIAAFLFAALLLSAAKGKYAQAVIECAPGRRASARVAEKLGFREEGMADGCQVFRQAVPRDGV